MIEILGLLIVAAVGWYVAWPLMTSGSGVQDRQVNDLVPDLEARRETLYREVADLDFDHSLGKIDDEDYRQEREAYISEAAAVLAELESTEKTRLPNREDMTAIEGELEEEIRRIRDQRAT
jgi:hypothetical protein